MGIFKKKIQTLLFSMVLLFGVLLTPVVVSAAPVDSACEGLTQVDPTVTCDATGSSSAFTGIIKRVIEILSVVVGAVSVVMIIIGGFKYIVSAGDSNGIQSAKNTILYALVGLVVAVFAQVIARFVLGQAT